MYSKLLKNFIFKNITLFLFLFFAIFISLLGFIFTDSLSKNFLGEIQADSKKSLGGDITISLEDYSEEELEKYLAENISSQVDISKLYTIRSSIKNDQEIVSANILFYEGDYPFYDEFIIDEINPNGKIIISPSLLDRLNEEKQVEIFDNNWKIYGSYQTLPSQAGGFLSSENIFIPMEYYDEIIPNTQSIFLEKKYFLQTSQEIFSDTKSILEKLEKTSSIRVRDYISGGERFEDIVSNIVSYINASVMFALMLTSVIIYLCMRSFFIKQRKNLAVLRVLGFQNKQFILFFTGVFASIFAIAGGLSVMFVKIGYLFLQSIEETNGFALQSSSIYEAIFIAVTLGIVGLGWPIYQFISKNPLSGFSENFFSIESKKQKIILYGISILAVFLFAILLDYTLLQAIIISFGGALFLIIFSFITLLINTSIFTLYNKKEKKNFEIFDAMRNTLKPGNLTFLLNISFFVIFFVGFFIFLLFGNFYNRLQVNLSTDNNLFILNIDQDIYKSIDEKYIDETYSTFRGRISEINNVELNDFMGGDLSRRFSREFNITDNSLKDIPIISGDVLQAGEVSVDDNFAKDLGVKLGDEITFQIFGLEKTLQISNIRQSQDYAINPFFYFQVYPEDFEKFPKQYFLSTQVASENIAEVKQYFYDISDGTTQFIEVEKILEEIKEISIKVLGVIQSLFVYLVIFCVLSIIVVTSFYALFAKQKSQLYYLLGSTAKQNQKREFFEYLYLGSVMFIFAIVVATVSIKYFLGINDFIIFDWNIWWKYLSIFIIIFIVLMGFISKFLQKK